jgi:hypothetical protein
MPFSLPPLKERTLTAVAHQRLAHDPDSCLVRDPARSLSCAQLYEEALAVAGGFAAPEVGVGAGEHVLLMLDNHVDYVVNASGARVMVIDRGYVPWLARTSASTTSSTRGRRAGARGRRSDTASRPSSDTRRGGGRLCRSCVAERGFAYVAGRPRG